MVFDDDDGVAFDVGVVSVAVATVVPTSIGFVDSSSFNGSPFRLTTVISTSTPCNFDATDCNDAHIKYEINNDALQSYYFTSVGMSEARTHAHTHTRKSNIIDSGNNLNKSSV